MPDAPRPVKAKMHLKFRREFLEIETNAWHGRPRSRAMNDPAPSDASSRSAQRPGAGGIPLRKAAKRITAGGPADATCPLLADNTPRIPDCEDH